MIGVSQPSAGPSIIAVDSGLSVGVKHAVLRPSTISTSEPGYALGKSSVHHSRRTILLRRDSDCC
jgi:hypothetical protein